MRLRLNLERDPVIAAPCRTYLAPVGIPVSEPSRLCENRSMPSGSRLPVGDVTVERYTGESLTPLREALYEAAFWRGDPRPAIEDALASAAVRRYLDGWGRPGDTAVVARDSFGNIGGAAWFRFFTSNDHGYGFVGEAVPEVGIGLQSAWRSRGIGGRLLAALHTEAELSGIRRLSLSVEADNPALRLYERTGYRKFELVTGSWTMVAEI
jgi:GNAT superfamily N-acetyltransferase